jgi:serine/threonine protein kinase/tetratricopeptide (TPR) repeat protein
VASYAIEELLGTGATGSVYRAFDERRQVTVAIKRLHQSNPRALLGLKNEFRLLADVRHRNLVALYELEVVDGIWFIVMEYVPGEHFQRYVSADVDYSSVQPFNAHTEARLRAALAQLCSGVHALHEAGFLHSDLKPANVLVRSDGQVTILDFGLTHSQPEKGVPSWPVHLNSYSTVGGTPSHMSPEQARCEPCTLASDWYSVGIMLHEALVGKLPVEGDVRKVLQSRRRAELPSLRASGRELPRDLVDLCHRLLAAAPGDRPCGGEVLSLLTKAYPSQHLGPMSGRRGNRLIGREQELQQLVNVLQLARDCRPQYVEIRGESGIGKTALVSHLLADPGGLEDCKVFCGRCLEHEHVPFKAIDGIIDSLGSELSQFSVAQRSALAVDGFEHLTQIFPVLREASSSYRPPPVASLHPAELRHRAFTALKSLFERLSRQHTIILFIDDLQWGDADSARLISAILSPPQSRILLLGTVRTGEADGSPFLVEMGAAASRDVSSFGVTRVNLGPLPQQAALSLAKELLQEQSDPELPSRIAQDSEGHPFFITELARYASHCSDRDGRLRAQPSLTDAITHRLVRLPHEARNLLKYLAIAPRPVQPALLLHAASLDRSQYWSLHTLRTAALVRGRNAAVDHDVELYHDRLRGIIVSALAQDELIELNARWAEVLDREGADPELLAVHYRGAQQHQRAAEWAERAARDCDDALAFAQAAQWFQSALDWGSWNREVAQQLCRRLALALHNAGQCAAAGAAYLRAADQFGDPNDRELRLAAADSFLGGGYIEEGLAIVRPMLRAARLGYPSSPRSALIGAAVLLVKVQWRLRRSSTKRVPDVAHAVGHRAMLCWSLAKGLAAVDPARGAYYLVLGLAESTKAGDSYGMARGLAAVAGVVLAPAGGTLSRWAELFLSRAAELASSAQDPYLLGLVDINFGQWHLQSGHWRAALDSLESADACLRDHGTGVSWERNVGAMCGLKAMEQLGQWSEFESRSLAMARDNHDRGDRYGEVTGYLNWGVARFGMGETDTALRCAAWALSIWSHERDAHLQHFYAQRICILCHLVLNQTADAHAVVEGLWPKLKQSGLLRIPVVRMDFQYLRAAAALRLAATHAAHRARALRIATQSVVQLERLERTDSTAIAAVLRAALHGLRGQPQQAAACLSKAERLFVTLGQCAHAAVCVLYRTAVAGESAPREASRAREVLEALGIRSVCHFSILVVPNPISA